MDKIQETSEEIEPTTSNQQSRHLLHFEEQSVSIKQCKINVKKRRKKRSQIPYTKRGRALKKINDMLNKSKKCKNIEEDRNDEDSDLEIIVDNTINLPATTNKTPNKRKQDLSSQLRSYIVPSEKKVQSSDFVCNKLVTILPKPVVTSEPPIIFPYKIPDSRYGNILVTPDKIHYTPMVSETNSSVLDDVDLSKTAQNSNTQNFTANNETIGNTECPKFIEVPHLPKINSRFSKEASESDVNYMVGSNVFTLLERKIPNPLAIKAKAFEPIEYNINKTMYDKFVKLHNEQILYKTSAVPNMETIVLNTETVVPNTEIIVLNTETMVPYKETIVPNTEVIILNTKTMVPYTETIVINTKTTVPNTETIVLNTDTMVPNTETTVQKSQNMIPITHNIVPHKQNIVPKRKNNRQNIASNSQNIISHNQNTVSISQNMVLNSQNDSSNDIAKIETYQMVDSNGIPLSNTLCCISQVPSNTQAFYHYDISDPKAQTSSELNKNNIEDDEVIFLSESPSKKCLSKVKNKSKNKISDLKSLKNYKTPNIKNKSKAQTQTIGDKSIQSSNKQSQVIKNKTSKSQLISLKKGLSEYICLPEASSSKINHDMTSPRTISNNCDIQIDTDNNLNKNSINLDESLEKSDINLDSNLNNSSESIENQITFYKNIDNFFKIMKKVKKNKDIVVEVHLKENREKYIKETFTAYYCQVCYKSMRSRARITRHIVKVHGVTVKELGTKIKVKEKIIYRCINCSKIFSVLSNFHKHVQQCLEIKGN